MTVTASKYALRENDLYETEEWATTVAINALKDLGLWRNGTVWTCHVLVPLRLLIYAAFASKAKGLFQPKAECFLRAL